jgi:hypothetical protein
MGQDVDAYTQWFKLLDCLENPNRHPGLMQAQCRDKATDPCPRHRNNHSRRLPHSPAACYRIAKTMV